jgi:RimJ/RimL family protein N-acetyltransferase
MRTKRLTLRPLKDEDAKAIAVLAGDWDIARMTSRIPYPYSEALAHQWISGLETGEFVRGIVLEDELIGVIGYLPGDDGSAEIGYWIGKPWWGRGYATEAAEALIRYCFRRVRLGRVICAHFVDNPASARVIAKLGFRLVGPGKAWCDARRREVETLKYERLRPTMVLPWRRAA